MNRKAALILELSRLRLEAGNLRGEIAQTEREKEALVAQAAMEAYEKWKAGEEFLEELEEAFFQARELEEENQEREKDIVCLEKTSRELRALKNNEELCGEEEPEKETEKEPEQESEKEPEQKPEKEQEKEAGTKKESEEEEGKKAEKKQTEKQEARFFCPRCGAVYAKKVNFCRRCGTPISSEDCRDSREPDIQASGSQNRDSQGQDIQASGSQSQGSQASGSQNPGQPGPEHPEPEHP